jgi:cyclopropane-fatty-acyl-phospholipid synthase
MKDAIRRNFDESVTAYAEYERQTGRFAALADRLCAVMSTRGDRPLRRVLDAGAGTGISSRQFTDGSTPVALDISRSMLEANPVEHRVQGDFDQLPFGADSFDVVAFTASLFLAPDPARAATEARRVLRSGAPVGAVAPLGWTTLDDEDVFTPLSRESRSPSGVESVETALGDVFTIETGTWSFETTADALRTFHAVPAMAARLYPRLESAERVERARELLSEVEGPLRQHWRWFVGV